MNELPSRDLIRLVFIEDLELPVELRLPYLEQLLSRNLLFQAAGLLWVVTRQFKAWRPMAEWHYNDEGRHWATTTRKAVQSAIVLPDWQPLLPEFVRRAPPLPPVLPRKQFTYDRPRPGWLSPPSRRGKFAEHIRAHIELWREDPAACLPPGAVGARAPEPALPPAASQARLLEPLTPVRASVGF